MKFEDAIDAYQGKSMSHVHPDEQAAALGIPPAYLEQLIEINVDKALDDMAEKRGAEVPPPGSFSRRLMWRPSSFYSASTSAS